jgi:endonuclease YncB( thermonuclease family)
MYLDDYKLKYKDHGQDTPYFSMSGVKTYARVCDVYDGDTITIVIEFNGIFLKFKTRLMGIDTCEIKSKNGENKSLALKARNRLIEMLTQKTLPAEASNKKSIAQLFEEEVYLVWVHCYDFDKYGRLLADCYECQSNDISLSDMLIKENLAYGYNGETKLTEAQQVAHMSENTE